LRRRIVHGGALRASLGLAPTLVALAAACSSPAKLEGEGGACTLVTDCQQGLICVPKDANQPDGARVCSNNPMAIVPSMTGTPQPDAGGIPTTLPLVDAEPVPDALPDDEGGASPDDATTTPPPEASTPIEASAPVEASTAADAAHD
jgi:hypothetical protein